MSLSLWVADVFLATELLLLMSLPPWLKVRGAEEASPLKSFSDWEEVEVEGDGLPLLLFSLS